MSMAYTFRLGLYNRSKSTLLPLIFILAIMIDNGQIMKQITAQVI